LIDEPYLESFFEILSIPPLLNNLPNTAKKIDKILDSEIISNRDGRAWWYQIHWKEKSPAKDTWLDHSDLQHIDSYVLEHYESFFTPDSMGSSSLPPKENDENIEAHARPKRKFQHVY